jgi:hypothetical protein
MGWTLRIQLLAEAENLSLHHQIHPHSGAHFSNVKWLENEADLDLLQD